MKQLIHSIFYDAVVMFLTVWIAVQSIFGLDFNTAMSNLKTADVGEIQETDIKYNTIYDFYQAIGTYYRDNDTNIYYSLEWRYKQLKRYIDGNTGKYDGVAATSVFKDELNNDDYMSWFDDYTDDVIIKAGIKDSDTVSEQIDKLARYIARTYTYDDAALEAKYSDTSSFMDVMRDYNISDCMTDAMLFQACCDKLGIPCRYVEGEQSGLHAWNIVTVDGKEYEVDVAFARKASDKSRYILFHSGRKIYYQVG